MNDDKNPSPGEPAGPEPAEQSGAASGEGAAGPPGAEEATRPSQPVPPAEQTSQLGQSASAAEQPGQSASAAEQGGQSTPAAEQPGQPTPAAEQAGQQPIGHYAHPGPWGMPLKPKQSGFRRFVAHRATQLVAVGVLGLVVGGGIVGGVMAATHHPGRPGMSQHHGGHRFDDGGPGPRHRVPDGGNEHNGPGFGNGG
ncbi:hypothetical protein F9C11_05750 [Amycolatopsis sp. VS8301801F10]|uniref:hypothetical protein n=1 Tax=Amycolatopsis sp. VS8301801F10 TaxID=2652442 RepID=UPI0038FC3C6A